jgi:hypothetical protein
MLDEYIKLFSGYDGDFGIADMSKAKLDSERNKLKPDYEWAGRPITPFDYKNHIIETDVVNEFPKEWTANVTKLEAMLGCRANVLIFETCLNILYENHGHSAENFS